MKVLALSESYPPDISGGATFAYEVSNRLVKNFDLDLTMITRYFPSQLKVRDAFPVERIRIPLYKTEGGAVSIPRMEFVRKAIEIVSKSQRNFDVMNLYFGAGANLAVWFMKKMQMLKIPIVMSFLGTTAGHWQDIKPFPLCNVYNFIETELIVGVPCEKYIVLDDGTGGYGVFVKSGIPKSDLVKIYQSVDCTLFKPMNSTKRGKFTIGYLGRLDPFKGLDTFIESMVLVNRKMDDFQILIRGDGPLKDWIVETSKKGGISSKLKFVPPVSKTDLPKFINGCDLMFFGDIRGYKNPDILSMAMAEAMACGSLFISSSRPRKEWGSQTWITLDEPDPKQLAEMVTDVAENGGYDKVRENARESALKFFDWDIVTEKIHGEFQKLV